MKRSPGRRRARNDSSTVPSRPPLTYCTVSAASLVMVPIDMRWRRADGAVGHRVEAVPLHHPAVLGVGGERRAAAGDEVERPVPLRRG